MAEENTKEKDPKKGGKFRLPPLVWFFVIAMIGTISLLFLFMSPRGNPEQLPQAKFLESYRAGAIKQGTIRLDVTTPFLGEITGRYTPPGQATAVQFRSMVHLDDALNRELGRSGLFEVKRPDTLLQNLLVGSLPILLVGLLPLLLAGLLIWIIFMRPTRNVPG